MLCPVVDLTMQLIRRPSYSPNDAGCQNIIMKRLKAIDFTIEPMNFGDTKNFWAWRGYGETLVFAGHTDVVPVGDINSWIYPPFEPTICNGILFGRGAADMKGSLAAMVIAAEYFVASYPNHTKRLAFLITSDEEASAKNGTVKVIEILVSRNERIDYCIIGEPSSIKLLGDVIKNGRRGSLNCNITIFGVQGHVAYLRTLDNPIHQVIPMLNELIAIKWDQGNKFFPETSMQIVNINSGTESSNIVPGILYLHFNFRFSNNLTDKIIKNRIINLLKKYNLRYSIKWDLAGNPFITQCGKLLDTVVETIFYFNRIKPQLLTTGGTSDGRFIARTGAQILELGPVNTTIHRINECVSVSSLQILALMYQRIMEKIIS